jgi:hypothetical protein
MVYSDTAATPQWPDQFGQYSTIAKTITALSKSEIYLLDADTFRHLYNGTNWKNS